MAFIPRKNPTIGSTVKLITYVSNAFGTFEPETIMKITGQNEDGYNLEDDYMHTISGIAAEKFIVIESNNDTIDHNTLFNIKISTDHSLTKQLTEIKEELDKDTPFNPLSGARTKYLYELENEIKRELAYRNSVRLYSTKIMDENGIEIIAGDELTNDDMTIVIDYFGQYIPGTFTYHIKNNIAGEHKLLFHLLKDNRMLNSFSITNLADNNNRQIYDNHTMNCRTDLI